MARLTQQQAIFYQLYKNYKGENLPIAVHKLIGEVYSEELNAWGFVSYEVSARMSEMFKENPLLFVRELTLGKSGAEYYSYRLVENAKADYIVNKKLKEFYLKFRTYESYKKSQIKADGGY